MRVTSERWRFACVCCGRVRDRRRVCMTWAAGYGLRRERGTRKDTSGRRQGVARMGRVRGECGRTGSHQGRDGWSRVCKEGARVGKHPGHVATVEMARRFSSQAFDTLSHPNEPTRPSPLCKQTPPLSLEHELLISTATPQETSRPPVCGPHPWSSSPLCQGNSLNDPADGNGHASSHQSSPGSLQEPGQIPAKNSASLHLLLLPQLSTHHLAPRVFDYLFVPLSSDHKNT